MTASAKSLLTASELRLIDVLLRSGALGETPAAIVRNLTEGKAGAGVPALHPGLRNRRLLVRATARVMNATVTFAPKSDLLRIRAGPGEASMPSDPQTRFRM